ncbi:MAG: deoxynucleoside kinase [Anaerolineae bacterium]|nr:deoxynucleoside kinase [Anaerolineae bacterium]
MRSFFLAIEGVIGVGKTTLARLLQPRFGAEVLLEAFEHNPFLSDFYADRARYAFQTQIFFLLSRYSQHQEIPALLARAPLITDYTFAKDSLFAQLNLSGEEWEVYKQLYAILADRVPLPDLVIYLRADTELLMLRIAMRDRAYERDMDRNYIEALRQAYEQYFSTYTQTPLLIIDTNDLDYVHDPGALAFIEGQVRTALGLGVHQRPLPQMEFMTPPARPASSPAGRSGTGLVADFLAANAAMGRFGGLLAEYAGPGKHDRELSEALREAMQRLRWLAARLGVES